jgi:dTDP-D-glucose 4,6-dehydratase
LDDNKLKLLGWSAQANFDTELKNIVKYYNDKFIW